jgi:hypothetical protein
MSWIITPELKTLDGIPWDQIPESRKWTPALLSTTVWLDAADASTVVLSGSLVSQWSDKSGNDNHWIQADPAQQGAYVPALINGRNGLSFSTGTGMATASAVFKPDTHTMIALVRPHVVTENDYVGSAGAAGNHAFSMFFQGKNRIHYWNSSGVLATSDSDATVLAGSVNIAGQSHSPSGSLQNIYNGIVKTTAANGTSSFSQVFTRGRPGTPRKGMDYGEVILTTSQLSTSDRQKLEGYLAHKWGVTGNLPADHPYKTAVPVP